MEIVDETDILTDNRLKQRRKETQNRQDFTDFAKINDEIGVQISPQMALAVFQYLSTAIEPFQRKFITESILRRLIAQKIYYSIEKDDIEERTYLTAYSIANMVNEGNPKLLYKFGKPADYFIMILEGKVKVIVGSEKLTYLSGPFTYFGVSALKPPVLATKMLLGGSSIGNSSNTALNNLNNNLNQAHQYQQQQSTILNLTNNSRPSTPDSPPQLFENQSTNAVCSRPGSPEINSIIRCPSSNSDLYHTVPHLESHSFIPDFTVKPIENTLYLKIPRAVYLAAFRASLMDRKDEFLESDLASFKEEVDNTIYTRLSNKTVGCNNQAAQNKTKQKSSSDIIKEKRFSISGVAPQVKFTSQETTTSFILNQSQQVTCNQIPASTTTTASSNQSSRQVQIANSLNKQRRSSIKEVNQPQPFRVQSPKPIRRYIKHQHSLPTSTNLSALSANNNSYTTVNNNLTNTPLTNIIQNPQQQTQLENVVIDATKDYPINKTKF